VSRAARPALRLSLQFADARHRTLLPRHRVARWVRAALDAPGEITVRLVDEAEGRALNRDYRGKDYATNVLTFDYERGPVVVADLVLCAPVVETEARAQRIGLEAHYAHLLVHGTLHAQGHEHDGVPEAEAAAMEARESALMLALGFADPYRRRAAPGPRTSRRARRQTIPDSGTALPDGPAC
jgi:probable rRNA maturation factor